MTSSMTLQELKRELTKHGVTLPKIPVTKEEYEQLYLEHVLSTKSVNGGRNGAGDFSSDDDMDQDDPRLVENDVGGGDTPTKAKSGTVWNEDLVRIVDEMTNEEIYSALVELGQIVGPVVASTRGMYRRKLLDLQSRNGELDLSGMLKQSIETREREGSPVGNGFSSDDDVETPDHIPDDAELLPREDKQEQRKQRTEEFQSSSQSHTYTSTRVETGSLFSSPGSSRGSGSTYGSQFSTPTGLGDQWATQEEEYRNGAKYNSKGKESAQRSSIYGYLFWGSFILFAAIAIVYYFLTYEREEAWKDEVDAQIDDILRNIPEFGNM